MAKQVLGRQYNRMVLVFLSKWDILRRWLSYGEDSALRRFEELTAGLLVDHDQPKTAVTS